jgi:hypothetical protein
MDHAFQNAVLVIDHCHYGYCIGVGYTIIFNIPAF